LKQNFRFQVEQALAPPSIPVGQWTQIIIPITGTAFDFRDIYFQTRTGPNQGWVSETIEEKNKQRIKGGKKKPEQEQ
jgi:hypothetical protein